MLIQIPCIEHAASELSVDGPLSNSFWFSFAVNLFFVEQSKLNTGDKKTFIGFLFFSIRDAKNQNSQVKKIGIVVKDRKW